MSLHGAPLLYVFYETSLIERQRELYEDIFGLPVIENQFHPPHEVHGLVKYDGGQIILSLNLSKPAKFEKQASDGLTTVFSVVSEQALQRQLRQHGYNPPQVPGSFFTDAFGHHYLFKEDLSGRPDHLTNSVVDQLLLTVSNLPASVAFYQDVLGLELREQKEHTARFGTGTVDLCLQDGLSAPDGRPIRYDTYLIVFYTEDIHGTRERLIERGMIFRSHRVGLSDIGYTVRFADPSGHNFCLYKPSEESLTWGSGPKVLEISSYTI
jgi:catechol 2,3-dioxygenase-like lactoylglutathione lyase family enzyme